MFSKPKPDLDSAYMYMRILSESNPTVKFKQWYITKDFNINDNYDYDRKRDYSILKDMLDNPLKLYTENNSLIFLCTFEKANLSQEHGSTLAFVNYDVYFRLSNNDTNSMELICYCNDLFGDHGIMIDDKIVKISPHKIEVVECGEEEFCNNNGNHGIFCIECRNKPETNCEKINFITNLLRTDLNFNDIPCDLIVHIDAHYTMINIDDKKDMDIVNNLLKTTGKKIKHIEFRKTQKYLDEKIDQAKTQVEIQRKLDNEELGFIQKTFDNKFDQVVHHFKEKQFDKFRHEREIQKKILTERMCIEDKNVTYYQTQIELLQQQITKSNTNINNIKKHMENLNL